MSFTTTPNYGLYKPTINADNDQWGNHLNTNADVLDSKVAPLNSPALTGSPTAPTVTPTTDNSTKLATTAFVQSALSVVPAGALVSPTVPTANPGTLWWDSTGGQLYLRYDDGNSQQWVTTSNVEGLANAATKTDVASTLNNVGRNLLHNSMFNIAQRGAGPFNTQAAYTVDRWQMYFNLDTASVSQFAMSDAIRAQIGDEAAQYGLSIVFTGNAGAAAYTQIQHKIENSRRLSGKAVTLSFYAVGSVAMKLGLGGAQGYGTGGSPSAPDGIAMQIVNLTTGWARYSVTFNVPSASGRTFGTNSDSYTLLQFVASSGATNFPLVGVQSGTIQLWGVQLEIAQPGQTQPTPLEKPDPELQLRQCQRFAVVGAFATGGYEGTTGAYADIWLQTVMRTSPTVVLSNLTYTNASAATVAGTYPTQISLLYSCGTGNTRVIGNYTASADL